MTSRGADFPPPVWLSTTVATARKRCSQNRGFVPFQKMIIVQVFFFAFPFQRRLPVSGKNAPMNQVWAFAGQLRLPSCNVAHFHFAKLALDAQTSGLRTGSAVHSPLSQVHFFCNYSCAPRCVLRHLAANTRGNDLKLLRLLLMCQCQLRASLDQTPSPLHHRCDLTYCPTAVPGKGTVDSVLPSGRLQ